MLINYMCHIWRILFYFVARDQSAGGLLNDGTLNKVLIFDMGALWKTQTLCVSHFSSDSSATKLIYTNQRNVE